MKEAKDFADRPAVNEGGQHTPDWPHSIAAHVLRRTGRTLAVPAAAVCCCCFSTVASWKEVPLCVSMDLAVLLLLLLHAHVQQTRFSQDWRQPLTGKPHSLSFSFSLPARNGWDKEWSLRFHSFIIFFAGFFFFPVFRVDNIYLYLFLSLSIYIYTYGFPALIIHAHDVFFFRRSFVPLFFFVCLRPFFFRDDGDSHQSRRLLRFPNSLVSSSQPPTIHSFRSGSCPRDLLIRLVVLPFCFG